MRVMVVFSLAVIPFGILISALRDRSLRRRSRFRLRLAVFVVCMVAPWTVALLAPVGEDTLGALLWIGLGWAVLLIALAPLLLFGGPGLDPGPSDDGGPGPEDDRQPPHRPIGGAPLTDVERPATRARGSHTPRRAAHPRAPSPERGRRPVHLWPVRLWPVRLWPVRLWRSPRHRAA